MTDAPPSRNETIKRASRALRGTLAEGLTRHETGALAEDDTQLTKFHGLYQQDDRDLRPERGRKKMEKAYSFMARLRIPGGMATPGQWLALEQIAQDWANGSLRLTTRETIQYHGIIKGNLRSAYQAIDRALLDCIAACGDVNRNVVASAIPWRGAVHAELTRLATALSTALLPRTRAYHEIWLDGEKVPGTDDAGEAEPLYGRTYLPRKFKIGIAAPPSNDVDLFAQDLGFIAIEEGGAIVGYNVSVGGGMGMTHGEKDTFPRLGDVIGFCRPDQAVAVAESVVTIQRDWGNRSVRKHARLKYTIERRGLPAFRAELECRLGWALAPVRPFAFEWSNDQQGWIAGDDGRWHHAMIVECGRIKDSPTRRLLTGLRQIAQSGMVDRFVITANQNLVLAGVDPADRPAVAEILHEHGLDDQPGGLRRNALACVALPTCGLALAEAERYLPDLLGALEAILDRHGLDQQDITLRVTGCPNGCARPYLAEIALVGRGPGLYNLYLGGAFDGTRLNRLHIADVTHEAAVAALEPMLAGYAAGRREGERFSDFLIRVGITRPMPAGNQFHADA